MTILFWGLLGLMTLIAVAILLFPMGREHKFLPVTVVMMLPIFAFTLYWHLGSSQKLQHYWVLKQEAKQVKTMLSKIKSPQQVVDQLKTYLRAHPNSPKGWYLLGKIYFGEKRYSEALSALKRAHQQEASNVQYAIAYAQASFFQNGRRLIPNVLKMLKHTVTIDPSNVAAINLLAINAYGQKDYKSAVHYWETILPLFQVGSTDQKMLLSMIAGAQKKILKGNK